MTVKLGTPTVQSGSYYDINERTAPLRPGRFKKNTSGKRRQKQAAQLSTSGGCEDKGGYLLHTDGPTDGRTDTMVKITFQSVSGQKVEKDNDKSEVLIPHAADEEELVLPLRPRKSPLNGLCCLTFGLVVFMASLVLASIYVYRYYFIHHNPRENLFHCSVLYEDSAYAPLRGPEQLEENIGIYLEDNYEKISVPVPHFGGSDPADIIHDFHRGLTAYHDIALDKCYVTELNTTVVMPPRNLWELLINVKKGTYLPQTYIIHEEMVVTGKVHNMRQLGPFIYRLCHGKDTYRLSRRLSHRRVSKRQTKDCHTIRHFENTFVVETLICDEA